MIKLLLVDDEELIRSGLKILLELQGDMEVVAQASSGEAANIEAKKNRPDLVLMDIRMPGSTGIDGIRLIRDWNEKLPILILTTFKDTEYILEAMNLGASGYLLKDSSPETIADGIRLALSGKVVMDSEVSQLLLDQQGKPKTSFQKEDYDLSEKEVDIMKLVATGYSNKEIAGELFLSEGTIKNNISLILQKLDLRDRTQLAIFALENNIKIS